jgi:hypothetical protein
MNTPHFSWKFLLPIVICLQAMIFSARAQYGGGTVIFVNSGPFIPYYSWAAIDNGWANGGAITTVGIPTGVSSWTVMPVNGDLGANAQWNGDYLFLTFSCGGAAQFVLNGGSYVVVFNSSGCVDTNATTMTNAPAPIDQPSDLGNPPPPTQCPDCGCPTSGMPIWRVSQPYISLWLQDEPLGYQPVVGPRISFKLDFKQRELASGFDTNLFSVGKTWHH